MIDFIVTLPTYEQDKATQVVWSWVQEAINASEGVCYYKHPVVTTPAGVTPELTFISPKYQPIVIRCLSNQLGEIQEADEEIWTINGITSDSPTLELEDFVIVLKSKLDKDRVLRNLLTPREVLALPLISKNDFEEKFGNILQDTCVIWSGGHNTNKIIQPLSNDLSELEWRHARSIVQGVNNLKEASSRVAKKATTLGEAIRILDRQIALLDEEQARAALQIAPGPQRIRGLAGTGKTVLLAMKAANIHLRYPDKKILFTFNTQSLYNQIKTLISKFYRANSDTDPNWDLLHVRHAWGGYSKPGVYFDLCGRLGIQPFNLNEARLRNRRSPFQACCNQVLGQIIHPEYDFILVDEAQDFPKEFFQALYKLSNPPRQIYFAYDELQSLSAEELPKPENLFGVDANGKPLVSLDSPPYPGNIEKDYVLHRSYRCPQAVLMLAHAIGLGLYNPKGSIQMLQSASSWEALGYELKSGKLETGEDVVIYRPPENSPNPILDTYTGKQDVVRVEVFPNREAEYQWIAESINRDVRKEGVAPDQIVVICLDSLNMKNHLPAIQKRLHEAGIASTIPGLTDDAAAFGMPGRVTLSTVFRAKGNEAYIVYISSFEFLYDYVRAIENRNRVFTAISRSKAWVRITGVGEKMKKAEIEVNRILADQPYFKFTFPNMELIRRLDAETDKRRRQVKKAKTSVTGLISSDPRAIEALAETEPELFSQLLERLQEVKRRESQ